MKIRIGHVWGIPIELHYSWFLVFGLLSYSLATQEFALDGPVTPAHWAAACLTTALFFACLLAHELAHCAVARRIGVRITGITLFIFGGMARMASEPTRPFEEFKMAAAGPAMSLALAAATFVGAGLLPGEAHSLINAAIYLAIANLALCVFNLLPAFPMDGGRMLRALLWAMWRDIVRATFAATRLSRVLGLLLMIGGLYVWRVWHAWNGLPLMLMGGFLIHAADIGFQQVRLRHALEGRRVRGLMTAPLPLAADLPIADALARCDLASIVEQAPVCAEGRLAGVLDLAEAASLSRAEQPFVPVSRLMRRLRRADLVRAESPAWNALAQMAHTGRRQLYVIRRGMLLGVIHLEQLLALATGSAHQTPGEWSAARGRSEGDLPT